MTVGANDFQKEIQGLIPQDDIRYGDLSRGISLATCRHYRYGTATYNGRPCQVAQWADAAGVIRAQKLRFENKQFMWLGEPEIKRHMFGIDLARSDGHGEHYKTRIIITEGELDCLAVKEAVGNWPVVSLSHGAGKGKIGCVETDREKLDEFDEIVLCLDNDEAGQATTQAILDADFFEPGKLRIVKFPAQYKDACDLLVAGEKALLRSLVWSAPLFSPPGIVTGSALIEAILAEPFDAGILYPWCGLNDFLGGIRPKELVLLTSATGSGKTTINHHLAAHLLREGAHVGYVGLEESVAQSALGIFGAYDKARYLAKTEIPVADITNTASELGDHLCLFDHFGSTDTDRLLRKLRHLAKGFKCTHIFLDHISIAISGLGVPDERKAIDILMTKLRSLVEETKITLFVVSHLKRIEGSHEKGHEVRLDHLRGSHSLAQLSDTVIAAERNTTADDATERNTTVFRVLKNRALGLTGAACKLIYSHEDGSFKEMRIAATNTGVEEDFSID